MNKLWAPWRLPFIQKKKKNQGCIFCRAHRGRDKEHVVVARARLSLAMLNIYPYNNGHLMVAPKRHTGDMESITSAEWADMMALVSRCQKALKRVYAPHGYNVGINVGRVAGAGITHHLHVHLVPRWNGDMNFMPVTAATKVLPQSLEESYRQIHAVMRRRRR